MLKNLKYELPKPPSQSSFLTYDLVFYLTEKQEKKKKMEENMLQLPPLLPTLLQLHRNIVATDDLSVHLTRTIPSAFVLDSICSCPCKGLVLVLHFVFSLVVSIRVSPQ